MKVSMLAILAVLGSASLLAGAGPALAQQNGPTYSVCIGNVKCTNANQHIKFDCNFAASHPTNTDAAAAFQVCANRWGPFTFQQPIHQRLATRSGGQCGAILINAICPKQAIYTVCIGQYRGNCPGFTAQNPLDYHFPCSFASAHPTATDQAAALQVCQSKGWSTGTAVRLGSSTGNQCGYIRDRVTCQ
jgi:hypothetical protein